MPFWISVFRIVQDFIFFHFCCNGFLFPLLDPQIRNVVHGSVDCEIVQDHCLQKGIRMHSRKRFHLSCKHRKLFRQQMQRTSQLFQFVFRNCQFTDWSGDKAIRLMPDIAIVKHIVIGKIAQWCGFLQKCINAEGHRICCQLHWRIGVDLLLLSVEAYRQSKHIGKLPAEIAELRFGQNVLHRRLFRHGRIFTPLFIKFSLAKF